MGGSRCTYRNCSVRSDGVVHMFHYPVYDKIRCHQWLVNAHRLDFLNLKLSQLRNRVVCQHHFKNECFMNYLKDKLTFDAIPTEDGPNCDTTTDNALPVDQIAKAYSAALNDVDETDKYLKKTLMVNPSMVYADYLTNGDVWEKQSLNETIWNNMVITKKEHNEDSKVSDMWGESNENQANNKCRTPLITLTDLIGDTNNTKITEFENPLLANINFNQNKDVGDHNNKIKSYKKSHQVSNNNASKQDLSTLIINQEPTDVNIEQHFLFPQTNLDNLLVSQKSNNNATVNCDIDIVDQNNGIKFYKKNRSIQKLKNKTVNHDLNNILSNQEITHVVLNQETNNCIHSAQNVDNSHASQRNNNIIVNFDNFVESNNIKIEKKHNISDQTIQTTVHKNKIPQTRQSLEIVTTTNDYCAIIENPSELAMQAKSAKIDKPDDDINNYMSIHQWKANQVQKEQKESILRKKPKVTILSEKTISDPVLVKGQLEPMSPSAFIHVLKHKTKKPTPNLQIKLENKEVSTTETKTNENVPPIKDVMRQKDNIDPSNIKKNSKPNEGLVKPFVNKLKIAPERVAAIEKKRNFNKRLIDIIEICLDKLEDQDKSNEEAKVTDALKVRTPKTGSPKDKANSLKQNIGTYLSKQAELPSTHEYMMKFLETRMKKMEDTLLNKIDQNSQRIIELKKSISQSPTARKATSTQTAHDQESYKKELYKEISKFLSPDANSLIYEELFINKYSHKLSNQPSPKKRKRR